MTHCSNCSFSAPEELFPVRSGDLRCPKCHAIVSAGQRTGLDTNIDPGPSNTEALASAPSPSIIREQKESLAQVFAQTSDAIESCPSVTPAIRLGWDAFRSHYLEFYQKPTTVQSTDEDLDTLRSFRDQLHDWQRRLAEGCPGIFPEEKIEKSSGWGDLAKTLKMIAIVAALGTGAYLLWKFHSEKKAEIPASKPSDGVPQSLPSPMGR